MNKRTVGGALAFGTILISGIVYILAAGPVDETELAKDGFSNCVITSLTCPIYLNTEKRAFLKANVAKASAISDTAKHLEMTLPVMRCEDGKGGGVLVMKAGGKFQAINQAIDELGVVDFNLCKMADCAGAVCDSIDPTVSAEIKTPQCAWRPRGVAVDQCRRADGSDPGDENTMMPGTWVGAGCLVKSCYVLAGEQE